MCRSELVCTYANFYAMRSNRRRVTRSDEWCKIERDTRGVVSRRKLSMRIQKLIAITIHVDRYCDPAMAIGYMVFTELETERIVQPALLRERSW